MLAALAVHPGEAVRADGLADLLWGEQPPPSWAKVVQGCVVRLRKLLGSHAIETTPLGYRLAVPLDEIDAQRFERRSTGRAQLLAAEDPERAALVLAEALALWRGPPLAELDGWDAARIEAARLEELRHGRRGAVRRGGAAGGPARGGGRRRRRRWSAEAPLRERRWALLATAQYQAGRQGEALRTLRRVRAVLDRELGLDPGPDIEALEQAILRQDPSLVVETALPEPSAVCPYRGLLPYDVDDAERFFGREADVAACLRRLADRSVLAVVGPSGCGKSSLVRAGVAAALRRDGERVVVITPGAHPVAALAALPGTGPRRRCVVDQCEEVFSLCQDAAERDAVPRRAGPARRRRRRWCSSFRADRLADISAHPAFARRRGAGPVPARRAWRGTTCGPRSRSRRRQAALVVEPGLVDLLVSEVADQPGRAAADVARAAPRPGNAARADPDGGRLPRLGRHPRRGGPVGRGGLHRLEPAAAAPCCATCCCAWSRPGPDGEPVRSRLPRRLVVTDPDHDADDRPAGRRAAGDQRRRRRRDRPRGARPARGHGCAAGWTTTSRASGSCTTWPSLPTPGTRWVVPTASSTAACASPRPWTGRTAPARR